MDREQIEIYEFGLQLLFTKLVHITTILIIGFLFKEFANLLFFLIGYKTIREYAGGYHCTSNTTCYMTTVALSIWVAIYCHWIFVDQRIEFISVCIASILIYFLCPSENKNNVLNVYEKKKYRIYSRLILCLYDSLYIVFAFCHRSLSKVLAMVLLSQMIMILYNYWDCTISQIL